MKFSQADLDLQNTSKLSNYLQLPRSGQMESCLTTHLVENSLAQIFFGFVGPGLHQLLQPSNSAFLQSRLTSAKKGQVMDS